MGMVSDSPVSLRFLGWSRQRLFGKNGANMVTDKLERRDIVWERVGDCIPVGDSEVVGFSPVFTENLPVRPPNLAGLGKNH